MNKKYLTFLLIAFICSFSGYAQKKSGTRQLLFKDNFQSKLDTASWHVELQDTAGAFVGTAHGKLILKTVNGVTVWYKKQLHGNIHISYDRKVVVNGGGLDRLSDLNQFWMASNPSSGQFFNKNGELDAYNDLELYYVGMGGNYNKTTRFRKYDGKGNRKLIGEYTDAAHLLMANQIYHIDLIVAAGEVSFWVDQHKYFSFHDPEVLKQGYFGFRSTKSNQEITDLKIFQLP